MFSYGPPHIAKNKSLTRKQLHVEYTWEKVEKYSG